VTASGQNERRYIDRVYSRLADGDHLLAVGTDVTDNVRFRLRQEANLRASVARVEHRLHTQFMQAPVAVAVINTAFVYEHANPLYLAMVGRTDVIGRSRGPARRFAPTSTASRSIAAAARRRMCTSS